MIEIFGIVIESQDIVIGLVTGMTYAALAAGFVLIYRATGVLNFAYAETGALGVALFVLMLVRFDINWWVAYTLAILAGAIVGGIIELTVIRRLFTSPRLVLLVATIGVAQLLTAIRINLPQVTTPGPIPLPFDWKLEIGSVELLNRDLIVLIVVPVLILGLGAFLNRTRFGLAVRATASNADTARIYGTSPKKTSTIVWVIGGGLATATAVLFAPFQISNAAAAGSAALAAPLLLRAITVGLLARMQSLPKVLLGGLAVGVVEQIVRANVESTNRTIVDLYLFLAVLVVVLFVGRGQTEGAAWSLSPQLKPVPEGLKQVWWVKHLNLIGFGILFGFFIALGLVLDSATSLFLWSSITLTAMVGVSLSLLTGWAGQLSLGQFAFVGLGGLTMGTLTNGYEIPIIGSLTLEWGVALVVSTLVGVVAAFIIGVPALRVRGLYLAVATLAFAVAAANWLFVQDVFTGGSSATRPLVKPVLGPINFGDPESGRRSYYWLCVLALALVCAMVAQLRRTGIGRSIIAVRENEDMAAASTVSPRKMQLTAFAIAGGIAAFAGGLFVTLQSSIQPATTFAPGVSIRMVAIAIIGGLGSVAGPVLGALWVQGIPALFDASSPPELVVLLTSSIGLLLLLMYFPGGLMQIVYSIRGGLLTLAENRRSDDGVQAVVHRPDVTVLTRDREVVELAEGQPALVTEGVSVQFGGNRAVAEVDFHVMPNELVGLIGTNGAGKSTLLNAISGLVPSTGQIEVLGREVNHMQSWIRPRLGLGRGFQAAKLYPELTVRETLMVSLEARGRSWLVPSMLHLPPSPGAERHKRGEADDIIDFLGLGIYADNYVSGLSTGTRRVVELGSLLAVDGQVLLLDEPTGGVAQKETEAFGPLIRRIQRELEAAVVVIEHDMPLVMSISDRVYCLEAGAVIAEGSPEVVREDPQVIVSYLGTDERAIQRSEQGQPAG